MPTQENVKPLILDQEFQNLIQEIETCENRISKNKKTLSEIQVGLTEGKKIEFEEIGEYSRDAMKAPLSFFINKGSLDYIIDDIDLLIAKKIANMILQKQSFVSDSERSYKHWKSVSLGVSDIDIIDYFSITQLSSFDEILVNVYDMIFSDLREKGICQAIAQDNQENLNLGYCELTDETGSHIYVIYLERIGKKPNGRMHYNLRHTKIPRNYRIKRHFLVKQS